MSRYFPRIKMCGMTRKEDIDYAMALGVDAIGLIFYKGSKRAVSIEKAKGLLKDIPVFMSTVAVIVNPTADEVWQIMQELPIQWLQFHGDETEAFCRQFRIPYIKAIPASSKNEVLELMSQYQTASAFLLDTPAESLYGGTGISFDWSNVPAKTLKPVILAGGLTANNIQQAINQVSVLAVDVCSGIEQSPGIKDHDKMFQFVNALRGNYEYRAS
ncbi:phosphoribosylanthranilate isomerase [Legionella sp. D16C41]|uniref:phosphoribosylanthranilate isomerase n=1 Tax=Legionella sp. D16C41 TaxID=3402688 RepID=UPI003AF8D9E4